MQQLARLWTLLDNKPGFIFYSVLRALSAFMPFANAILLGKIIDSLLAYTSAWIYYVLAIIAIGIAGTYLRFYAKFNILEIGLHLRKKIKLLCISSIMQHSLERSGKENSGAKLEKISTGAKAIDGFFQMYCNQGFSIIFGFTFGIIGLFFYNWILGTIALAFVLIYFIVETVFNRILINSEKGLQTIEAQVSGRTQEILTNIHTVKSLGLHQNIHKKSGDDEDEYIQVWKQRKRIGYLKSNIIKGYSALAFGAFIGLIAFSITQSWITVGLFVTLSSFFGKIRNSCEDITNYMSNFIRIQVSIDKLLSFLDSLHIEEKTEPGPQKWTYLSLKNLHYSYQDKQVLKGINIQIKKTSKIGIIGKSGQGKSTLLKLLIGLLTPKKGAVKLGNVDIHKIKPEELSKLIAVVPQNIEVFNRSLQENISLVQQPNQNKIKQVIKAVQLDKLVASLPKGVNTLIGEKGYKLSGGERQRLAIARALYMDTDILILDEATSHLDVHTEQQIQKELDKLDKTLIVVAHRTSTLKQMDEVYELKEGVLHKQ